jgi:hypothetical protein
MDNYLGVLTKPDDNKTKILIMIEVMIKQWNEQRFNVKTFPDDEINEVKAFASMLANLYKNAAELSIIKDDKLIWCSLPRNAYKVRIK